MIIEKGTLHNKTKKRNSIQLNLIEIQDNKVTSSIDFTGYGKYILF